MLNDEFIRNQKKVIKYMKRMRKSDFINFNFYKIRKGQWKICFRPNMREKEKKVIAIKSKCIRNS